MLRDITKNMKSLLQILLVLLIGFSIVACSAKQDVEEDDDWFEIVTEDGSSSGSQGTTFRITATKDENGNTTTTVEVFEGEVETEVKHTEEKVTITDGKSVEISKDQVNEGQIDYDNLPEKVKDKVNH